ETLAAVVEARQQGTRIEAIARAFHRALARAIMSLAGALADAHQTDTIVLSGGVMQNDLLLSDIRDACGNTKLHLWTNRKVPPNDGGISLGQAALAAIL